MKNYIIKTLNGMAYGLFGTLIIGVIVSQIAGFLPIDSIFFNLLNNIATVLKALMGIGIGIGIATILGITGMRLIAVAITGAIATSFTSSFTDFIIVGINNEPLTVYLVVAISSLLIIKIFKKRTSFDIIIVPLGAIIIATVLTFLFSAPIKIAVSTVSNFIISTMTIQPLLMGSIIAVVMGILLTSPLSSAAISIAIGIEGLAAGAAVIGCSCQMIGIAIQSIRDNRAGSIFAIAFGTSMIQFKNIIVKPVLWIPSILSSAILAPLALHYFSFTSNMYGAGMGTSGLVGVLQSLQIMNYSVNSFIAVGLFCFLLPAVLTFFFDALFRIIGAIKKGDFELDSII